MNQKTQSDDGRPQEGNAGSAGKHAKEAARSMKDAAREAREAAREAAETGKARLEARRESAASSVQDVADAVDRAAAQLSDADHEGLARYAQQLAGYLDGMSERLRNQNVDELTSEIRRIARRNPAMFIIGSVAVGLALSRLAKARARGESRSHAADDYEASAADFDDFGNESDWTGSRYSATTSGSAGGPVAAPSDRTGGTDQ